MENALIGALIVAAILIVAAVAAAYWVRRAVLRRWRLWRGQAAVSAAQRVGEWAGSLDLSDWATLEPISRSWRTAHRARRRMVRAVGDARHAVDHAVVAGVAVGDLPSLVRQSEVAAAHVEALLRVEARRSGDPARPDGALAQAAQVTMAAERIRQAAVASISERSAPAARSVALAADQEAAALLIGLARSRAH